jgi:hypothetical protein
VHVGFFHKEVSCSVTDDDDDDDVLIMAKRNGRWRQLSYIGISVPTSTKMLPRIVVTLIHKSCLPEWFKFLFKGCMPRIELQTNIRSCEVA